ncbi:conserved hypothetical protein [Beggiatoa sp. PS]|nr:conserved hypothetical protein [Beggiatoa sp. PS]
MMETITLFRPIGQTEMDLIVQSDYLAFPPRLPFQPIFYPVLQEDYAVQIHEIGILMMRLRAMLAM